MATLQSKEHTSSNLYTTTQDFDQKNSDSMHANVQGVGSNADVLAIEEKVRGFAESSRVLMKVLDEVQKLHPFVGIAVLAFKAVVTLEFKRRDKSQKIIALQVKMQDMMSVLVWLRGIRPEQTTPDGTSIKDGLQGVMNSIASDIEACGNVCDLYSKKISIVTLLKAPIYEDRLADFASVFSTHTRNLKFGLLMFTATGVDSANRTPTDVRETLRDTQEKVSLMAVFRKLDTPYEKELLRYIASKGGPEKCIQDDTALKELGNIKDGVAQRFTSGQGQTMYAQPRFKKQEQLWCRSPPWNPPTPTQPGETQYSHRASAWAQAEWGKTRLGRAVPAQPRPARDYAAEHEAMVVTSIRKELNEDLDRGLKDNLAIFGRKLFVQQQQLVKELGDIVERQDDKVIDETRSGPHDRIIDPVLRTIWKDLDWKRSACEHHFVQALRDYFEEQYHDEVDPVDTYLSLTPPSVLSAEVEDRALVTVVATAKKKASDMWAFTHINSWSAQPMLDAFDDDSTGYVSIMRANQLIRSKPDQWSLPQWVAYWSAGWHFVVWEYRSKICRLIEKIHDAQESILPTNRFIVDEYLNSPALNKICALLGSLEPCAHTLDPNLARKVSSYTRKEEARIENNLRSVKYDIDAPDTLVLVTGPRRIEQYICPLIFLLLKHHFRIINIASREVLHRHEFSVAMESMRVITDGVDARVDTLQAIFRQRNFDIVNQLQRFAFGMFHLLYTRQSISVSSLQATGEDQLETEEIDTSILSLGVADGPDVTAYETRELDLDDLACLNIDVKNLIEGLWTGHLFGTDNTICFGLIEIVIDTPTSDGHFHGRANDCHGVMNIQGQIQREIHFEAVFTYSFDRPALFIDATLDPTTGTINGKWALDPDRAQILGTLRLYHTPVSTYGFRYPKEQYGGNPARARWSFACSAIRYHVRQRLGIFSWRLISSRFQKRRRFAELVKSLDVLGYLSDTQNNELQYFKWTTSPADARFYISIARSRFDWSCLHLTACSWCQDPIMGARVICLRCFSWTSQIDLCGSCMNTKPLTGEFYHHWSHPLLKTREFLHNRQKPVLITKANELARRIQDDFHEPKAIHSPRPRFAMGPPGVITEDTRNQARVSSTGGVPNDLRKNDNATGSATSTTDVGASREVTGDNESGANVGRDEPQNASPATADSESSGARTVSNEAETLVAERSQDDAVDPLARAPVTDGPPPASRYGAGTIHPRLVNEWRCSCCGREISDTFWICVSCEKDTFICEDCDQTDRNCLDKTSTHKLSHPLLRLTPASWQSQVTAAPSTPATPHLEPNMTTKDLLWHQALMDQRFTVLNAQLADNLITMQALRRSQVATRRIAATLLAVLLAFAAVVVKRLGWNT